MTDLTEMANELRRMGEPPSSVDYLLRQSAPITLDPRGLTMDAVVAALGLPPALVLPPNPNTGD